MSYATSMGTASKSSQKIAASLADRAKPRAPQGQKVSAQESNNMFLYWIGGENGNHRPLVDIAKKFRRQLTTVYRVKKRDGWEVRYEKVLEEANGKIDDKAALRVFKVRNFMVGALLKIAEALEAGKKYLVVDSLSAYTQVAYLGVAFAKELAKLERPDLDGGIDASTHNYYVNYVYGNLDDGQRERVDRESDAVLETLKNAGRFKPA